MTNRDQALYCPLAKDTCLRGQVSGSDLTCRMWVGHECAIYIYLVTVASKQA